MDRFIVKILTVLHFLLIHLKSNMDRFIVETITEKNLISLLFKIQYG